jgi:hypothetical protein
MSNANEASKTLKYQGIVSVNFENMMKIKEGKFSLKEINNKSLTALLSDLDKNTKTQFLVIEKIEVSDLNAADKKSIIIATNQKFIAALIAAKIVQKSFINDLVNYGDKSLDSYKNLLEMVDILNAKYTLTENLELQIGNNIYPFINKPFKSELDNTMLNSLNLLAINF